MVSIVLKRNVSPLLQRDASLLKYSRYSTYWRHPSWWWDRTWNTCGGCRYQSVGCLLCYAAFDAGTLQQEAGATRFGSRCFPMVLLILRRVTASSLMAT